MDPRLFNKIVETLISLDFVKSYQQTDDTSYDLDIETGKYGNRSQIVHIRANGEDVIAFSRIGECSYDPEELRALLSENRKYRYSRVSLLDTDLYQLFRYPFEELEPVEFGMAVLEVAQVADDLERRYFSGVDQA